MLRYLENGFADRDQDREGRGGRISQLCMRGWRKSQGKPWVGGAKDGSFVSSGKVNWDIGANLVSGVGCPSRFELPGEVSFAEGLERSAAKSILERARATRDFHFGCACLALA